MTREQAKAILPFIIAYAEGKNVQRKIEGEWVDIVCGAIFDVEADPSVYRIKPKFVRTRAERLMDMMTKIYPNGVFYQDVAFEFIEKGGQVNAEEFREYLERNGYWKNYF